MTVGLFDFFKSKKIDESLIATIMVTLKVGEDQSLFIMLANDGSINRMGNGSENRIERDMFIGKTSTDAFDDVKKYAPAVISQWIGGHSDRSPVGKLCELGVGFQMLDGKEMMSQWHYGSQSQGPPPEVTQLVIAAVKFTNDWYESQKEMVRAADSGDGKAE
jgi:hypothetical protein